MRYVLARYRDFDRENAYRIYVTDVLKGAYGVKIRYADIFKPEDNRTAEDIKKNISGKLAALGGEE